MCLIKSICFLVPIAALCCGFTFAVDKRIVNGVLATIEKYPYMVSLRTTKNVHFCGGSIVNRYYVLTSARCLSLVPTFVIVTGTNDLNSGGATYSVAKILKHPSFDTNTMNYDAGIAKVTVPIVLSATVAPVVLSSIVPSVGTNVVVTGWGYKIYPGGAISPLLQALNTTVISNSACQKQFSLLPYTLQSTQMCAYKAQTGACIGDFGGPLAYGNLQYGILSTAVFCATSYPDVYTKIADVYIWIQTNV